jgi:uncharacterized protein (DUF433 family)
MTNAILVGPDGGDCLEEGYSVEGLLDDFPTVSREQVIAALELLRELLLSA